jgi:hypothetical protein
MKTRKTTILPRFAENATPLLVRNPPVGNAYMRSLLKKYLQQRNIEFRPFLW